ncbi:MAG: hypothetical protein KAR73_14380, partial [Spirochaetales bacterium]|nr:hypothetical protein [Spirochaetales bacterium]
FNRLVAHPHLIQISLQCKCTGCTVGSNNGPGGGAISYLKNTGGGDQDRNILLQNRKKEIRQFQFGYQEGTPVSR